MIQWYTITGMTCVSCAKRVEQAIQKIPGVLNVSVHFTSKTASVEGNVSSEILSKAVSSAGYGALPLQELEENSDVVSPSKMRFIVSFVLALPVFCLGMFEVEGLFSLYTQMLLSLLILVGPGGDLFYKAWCLAKQKSASMDTLVSIGSATAWGLSFWSFWTTPSGEMVVVYFESSAVIITFVKLGRFLEEKAKSSAGDAIRSLMKLAPKTVTIINEDEEFEEVLLDSLKKGQHLLIRPGGSIPVDGIVIKGESSVDESALTGEALPDFKKKGASVFAGTLVVEGVLTIEAQQVGAETSLAQTIEAVRKAQDTKAASQRLADQVSSIFIPLIFFLAFLTLLGWLYFGASLEQALISAATVLLIACPCALGLATPVAVMVACGKAAKLGLIIQSAQSLEKAGTLNTILLDKTGTLTKGSPIVSQVISLSGEAPESFKSYILSVESSSEHPIARALSDWAGSGNNLEIENFQSYPGKGVEAELEGKRITIGTRAWIGQEDLPQIESSYSEVVFCLEGKPLLLFGLEDPIRPEAEETLAQLRYLNIETILATGDREGVARKVGKQLGIEKIHFNMRPDEKLKLVQAEIASKKAVGFIGDGINDAASLANATVGFAMGGGTGVAIQSADITLRRSELSAVLDAISLAKKSRQIIRQNLGWAFGYNFLALPLAAFGYLNPMIASGAMAFSSFSVVMNSLRLRWFTGFNSVAFLDKESIFVEKETSLNQEKTKKEEILMEKVEFKVEGMTCQNCVRHVRETLEKVEGVTEVEVILEPGKATVTTEKGVDTALLLKQVEEAGYQVSSL